jgi:hypothetical protein
LDATLAEFVGVREREVFFTLRNSFGADNRAVNLGIQHMKSRHIEVDHAVDDDASHPRAVGSDYHV